MLDDRAKPQLIHATALAYAGTAVLLRGASGAGKSDLALRCLALKQSQLAPYRFGLIADDQVHLTIETGRLIASGPRALRGLIEVRGVGIVRVTPAVAHPVRLVVDLVDRALVPRLPEPDECTEIAGFAVPCARLDPWTAAAPVKLALIVMRVLAAPSSQVLE